MCDYNPAEDEQLDSKITPVVVLLYNHGVETYESCEGGKGHAYHEPTIRFHGGIAEGYKVYALLTEHGVTVHELRRVWVNEDKELKGPVWEVTLMLPDNRAEYTWIKWDIN